MDFWNFVWIFDISLGLAICGWDFGDFVRIWEIWLGFLPRLPREVRYTYLDMIGNTFLAARPKTMMILFAGSGQPHAEANPPRKTSSRLGGNHEVKSITVNRGGSPRRFALEKGLELREQDMIT